MPPIVDVLIPTYRRPAALSVLLTSLIAQTERNFSVFISDQASGQNLSDRGVIKAVVRVLESHGEAVTIQKHLPRNGLAEQRQFLLDQCTAPYALFLDDDLILEPYVIENLLTGIQQEQCGFIGMGLIGLSYSADFRPDEQQIEFWDGPVQPEIVQPESPSWQRYRLHNAANLLHVQEKLKIQPQQPKLYKVAWVGGCVLYDVAKLRSVGGFSFWRDLPRQHAGEDVLAQLRVMSRYGGCGILPSGAYHQELPTTVVDRSVDAPKAIGLSLDEFAPEKKAKDE